MDLLNGEKRVEEQENEPIIPPADPAKVEADPEYSADSENKPEEIDRSQAYQSSARFSEAVNNGTPLNLYGPMGGGKTTLAQLTTFDVIDDSDIWKFIVDKVTPTEANDYGVLFDALGARLPEALADLIMARVGQDAESFDRKCVNLWIPYLPEPFLNVYLLVRRDAVIQSGRLSSVSPEDHVAQVSQAIDAYLSKPNVIVFRTEDEVSVLLGAGDE